MQTSSEAPHALGRAAQLWLGHAARLRLFAALSVCILLLPGCSLSEDDAPTRDLGITLQSADNGSSIDASWGEHIVVELDSNPTTGFEWAIDDISPPVLGYEGSVYEAADADQARHGGTQRLTFQALNTGQSPLRLKYWRSWEGDASTDEEFTVTVNVAGR